MESISLLYLNYIGCLGSPKSCTHGVGVNVAGEATTTRCFSTYYIKRIELPYVFEPLNAPGRKAGKKSKLSFLLPIDVGTSIYSLSQPQVCKKDCFYLFPRKLNTQCEVYSQSVYTYKNTTEYLQRQKLEPRLCSNHVVQYISFLC